MKATNPLIQVCPTCGAGSGEQCLTVAGTRMALFHAERKMNASVASRPPTKAAQLEFQYA